MLQPEPPCQQPDLSTTKSYKDFLAWPKDWELKGQPANTGLMAVKVVCRVSDQYLVKIWTRVWCYFFMTHYVYICCLLSAFIKQKWWCCVADCVVLEQRSRVVVLWNVQFVITCVIIDYYCAEYRGSRINQEALQPCLLHCFKWAFHTLECLLLWLWQSVCPIHYLENEVIYSYGYCWLLTRNSVWASLMQPS